MSAESLFEPPAPRRAPPPEPPPTDRPRFPGWSATPTAGQRAAPLLSLLLVAGAGAIYLVSEKLGDNVARVENAFAGLDEATRPPATEALTFLLVGTDSRSESTPPGVTANGSGSGADVVMVAHVAPDRRSATVVSIPRDSWVDIPARGGGRVSAAYAIGGPSLLIKTVESLTALRVDHFAVIDFAGFRSMVDAIGGIDVAAAAPGASPPAVVHMNGAQALVYVRDRCRHRQRRTCPAPAERAARDPR